VSEHLHERIGCKTIFATHYHELVQLADELVAVRNYNVGVREVGDQILFLHRLQPGGADRSYGIEVGRLAGLPAPVIERARQVLALLEGEGATLVPALASALAGRADQNGQKGGGVRARKPADADQFALFAAPPHAVVEALRVVDINTLTPLAALQLVAELAERARA
jgi:DNA mismatch repair protein MutS